MNTLKFNNKGKMEDIKQLKLFLEDNLIDCGSYAIIEIKSFNIINTFDFLGNIGLNVDFNVNDDYDDYVGFVYFSKISLKDFVYNFVYNLEKSLGVYVNIDIYDDMLVIKDYNDSVEVKFHFIENMDINKLNILINDLDLNLGISNINSINDFINFLNDFICGDVYLSDFNNFINII